MWIALAGGNVRAFRADEVEIEHTYEESQATVNPCVGRSVQTSAITSTTPAPSSSTWNAVTY
jgi:hypothetical protein